MYQSAKQIAEFESFQVFINCYLKEIDKGNWVDTEDWIKHKSIPVTLTGKSVIEFELTNLSLTFALEVNYHSLTGRHLIGQVLKYCPVTHQWIIQDYLPFMITLIQDLDLTEQKNKCTDLSHFDELTIRLIDSFQTMTTYIEARRRDAERLYSEDATFIETEQSLLFGHWMHPTPKSRQGMANWQHPSFAPELNASFLLHYFQVDRNLVEEASSLPMSASEMIQNSLERKGPALQLGNNDCIIPVHPLQAQWLLQQDYIKEAMSHKLVKYLGAMGEPYLATSSIRTVYSEVEEWMYKFSIPVKVTNSLRVNQTHELIAGTIIYNLMKKLNYSKDYFRFIEDPAYIKCKFPGREESGLELIIRSNKFLKGNDMNICSIAALVQTPLPGYHSKLHCIIDRLAKSESRSTKEVSIDWFQKYWRCSIEPLIRLYDEHGLALEAHQQNSLLDLSTGYPETYYYRDNQGYYLSKTHCETLFQLEPSLKGLPELFYEDALIQERFTYYLIQNQLFSIIHRFGQDSLISEESLVQWVREQLIQMELQLVSLGKQLVQKVLYSVTLPYKANLLTRLHDVDELLAENEQAVYTKVPNPFTCLKKEKDYEKPTTIVV